MFRPSELFLLYSNSVYCNVVFLAAADEFRQKLHPCFKAQEANLSHDVTCVLMLNGCSRHSRYTCKSLFD